MEALLEILLQFLGEVVLQILFEAIAELALHSVREPFRRPKPLHPWLACLGYGIFGAVGGALSLWVVPALFIKMPEVRIANLVLAPIISGAAMSALGAWRRSRELELVRLDRFAYGYVFALAMAAIRFTYGH